jgi:hypothetical protein
VDRVVRVAKAEGGPDLSLREENLQGHIINEQQKIVSDARPTNDAATDPQLERALDLLKTWNVFSRGQGDGLAPISQSATATQ